MTEFFDRLHWRCPQCNEELSAYSQDNIELIKRLHIRAHHNLWVGQHPTSDIQWFNGRVQDSENGTWSEWNDIKFALECGIDLMADDVRTEEEIHGRWK
jgi:pullulanase/glycogen debranching enzyme